MSINLIDVYVNTVVSKSSSINLLPVVRANLQKAVHSVQLDILNTKKRAEGYCATFLIPEKQVLTLFDEFKLFTLKDLTAAFSAQWAIPVHVHMANNPYYHMLCFCILVGAKTNDEKMCDTAMALMLFKLWNGRRVGAIPYCNPETMAYVISQMTFRFHVKKHDSPYNMIMDYFVPTILSKYKSYILRDSTETKRLFEAAHNRLRQLFRSNSSIDLATGKEVYLSGIQPAYFDASEKKLKISNTIATDNIEDALSSNSFDDKIDEITDYIIMNSNPHYPEEFITFLKEQSRSTESGIMIIINALHSRKYRDFIQDILQCMFNRMSFISKQVICSKSFLETVQKSVITSKHNIDVNKAKELADHLLSNILSTSDSGKPSDYFSYLDNRKAQLRRVIFYVIAQNIQKCTCKG